MSSTRRAFVARGLTLAILLLPLTTLTAYHDSPLPQSNGDSSLEPEEPEAFPCGLSAKQWDRLLSLSSETKPKRVRLTMLPGTLATYLMAFDKVEEKRLYAGVGNAIDVQSTAEDLLSTVEVGCMMPIRYVTGSGGFGAGGGHQVVGRLIVTTAENEDVTIAITGLGLTLGDRLATSDNIFFSYGLACVIDDLFRSQAKRHLPQSLLDALSGARHIKAAVRDVEWIRATIPTAIQK